MTALATTQKRPSVLTEALVALVHALQSLHSHHARRQAMAQLLELDPDQLRDLGVTAGDVRDAMANPMRGGHRLTASRARAALSWSAAASPAH